MSRFFGVAVFCFAVLLVPRISVAMISYGYDDGNATLVDNKVCFYTESKNDDDKGPIDTIEVRNAPRNDEKAEVFMLWGNENPKRGRSRDHCFVVDNLKFNTNQAYDIKMYTGSSHNEPHYLSFCLKENEGQLKVRAVENDICQDKSMLTRTFPFSWGVFPFFFLGIWVLLFLARKSHNRD